MQEKKSLPLGKVEANEIVLLCYINGPFFKFTDKIESIFHTLLSERNVAFYGTVIIGDIAQEALNKEDLELELFLTNTYEGDIISEVLRRIIWSYGWLQGNVFVRKCNAKVGVQHHKKVYLSLGTPSAIASTNTKKGGGGKKSNGGVEKSNS